LQQELSEQKQEGRKGIQFHSSVIRTWLSVSGEPDGTGFKEQPLFAIIVCVHPAAGGGSLLAGWQLQAIKGFQGRCQAECSSWLTACICVLLTALYSMPCIQYQLLAIGFTPSATGWLACTGWCRQQRQVRCWSSVTMAAFPARQGDF
jgi:hypothetical protein